MLIAGDRSQQNHHPISTVYCILNILRMEMNNFLEPHTLLVSITSLRKDRHQTQWLEFSSRRSHPPWLLDPLLALGPCTWLGPRLRYHKNLRKSLQNILPQSFMTIHDHQIHVFFSEIQWPTNILKPSST